MQVRPTPMAPSLHASASAAPTATAAITTPVAWIFHVVVVRRPSLIRRHLDASGERQQDEHGGEPPIQAH